MRRRESSDSQKKSKRARRQSHEKWCLPETPLKLRRRSTISAREVLKQQYTDYKPSTSTICCGPRYFGWVGLNEREKKMHTWTKKVGLGVTFLYFPIVFLVTSTLANWDQEEYNLPTPSKFRAIVSVISLCACLYILYVQNVGYPGHLDTDPSFTCMTLFGPFIYLTRNNGTLQLVHTVFSAIAELSLVGWIPLSHEVTSNFVSSTYASAVFTAGLGTFVTIQFYKLVAPRKENIENYNLWLPRGWDVKWFDDVVHRPPLILAFVDILLVKDRISLVERMPKTLTLLMSTAVYAIVYLSVLHVNKAVTGFWPYTILEDVDASGCKAFCLFILLQILTLFTFVMVAWCAVFICEIHF